MSRGVNLVILVGHVGKDPDIRYSNTGAAIGNCSLATTDQWKDAETGDKKEATEWHRLVAFGKTAEIMGQYVKKGSHLYVEGKVQTRKWQDKEGRERYSTEVVVNVLQMLGGKGDGRGQVGDDQVAQQAAEYERRSGRSKSARQAPADFDDDISF